MQVCCDRCDPPRCSSRCSGILHGTAARKRDLEKPKEDILQLLLDALKLVGQAQGWTMPLQSTDSGGPALPNSSPLMQTPKSGPGFPGALASWVCLPGQAPAGALSNLERAGPRYCSAKKTLSAGGSQQRNSWHKQASETVRSLHLFALCSSTSFWKHLTA